VCRLHAGPMPLTPGVAYCDISVLTTFTLAEVGAPPEPSSYLLLGTGLLGALSIMRKRFV
jgi:hypothetical protein